MLFHIITNRFLFNSVPSNYAFILGWNVSCIRIHCLLPLVDCNLNKTMYKINKYWRQKTIKSNINLPAWKHNMKIFFFVDFLSNYCGFCLFALHIAHMDQNIYNNFTGPNFFRTDGWVVQWSLLDQSSQMRISQNQIWD